MGFQLLRLQLWGLQRTVAAATVGLPTVMAPTVGVSTVSATTVRVPNCGVPTVQLPTPFGFPVFRLLPASKFHSLPALPVTAAVLAPVLHRHLRE